MESDLVGLAEEACRVVWPEANQRGMARNALGGADEPFTLDYAVETIAGLPERTVRALADSLRGFPLDEDSGEKAEIAECASSLVFSSFVGDEGEAHGSALWLANHLLLEDIVIAIAERSVEDGHHSGDQLDFETWVRWSVLAYERKAARRVAGQQPPRFGDTQGLLIDPADHLAADADDREGLRAFTLANLVVSHASPAEVATEEAVAFARMSLHQIDSYVDAAFRWSTISPETLAGVLATPAAVRSGWL